MSAKANQILFVMKKLICIGKTYFPIMDTIKEKFKNFKVVIDSGVKYGDLLTTVYTFTT